MECVSDWHFAVRSVIFYFATQKYPPWKTTLWINPRSMSLKLNLSLLLVKWRYPKLSDHWMVSCYGHRMTSRRKLIIFTRLKSYDNFIGSSGTWLVNEKMTYIDVGSYNWGYRRLSMSLRRLYLKRGLLWRHHPMWRHRSLCRLLILKLVSALASLNIGQISVRYWADLEHGSTDWETDPHLGLIIFKSAVQSKIWTRISWTDAKRGSLTWSSSVWIINGF